MSFDFLIPGKNRPLVEVRFFEDDFLRLRAAAVQASLPQLLRADDYYGLVEYSAHDVHALASELNRIDPAMLGPRGPELLGQVQDLLGRAMAMGVGVTAAGD